jgi:hypothetical protein
MNRPSLARRLLARTPGDYLLLLEAGVYLVAARLLLLVMPFNRIAPIIGKTGRTSDDGVPSTQEASARRIGWAIGAVARRSPLPLVCLPQAMAAQWMLHRRSLSGTLYLGVAKNDQGALEAHAWTRCGRAVLTGAAGHERYTVVGTFAR